MRINLANKRLKVKGEPTDGIFLGLSDTPGQSSTFPCVQYRIIIRNGKTSRRFYAGFPQTATRPSNRELIEAVRRIFLCAEMGSLTFSQFCRLFRYPEHSRIAQYHYRACQRILKGVEGLGFSKEEIFASVDMIEIPAS